MIGIRLPEIEVPVATYTGWSLRNPVFSNSLRRNAGGVWPFSTTAKVRQEREDSRRSIAERFPTRSAYLAAAADSIADLRRERFLLDEDVTQLLLDAVEQASLLFGDLRSPVEVAIEDGAEAARDHLLLCVGADLPALIGVESPGQLLGEVNSRGYELMTAGHLEEACRVFELNTLVFAENWIVWDSLGECELASGNRERAIDHYRRSLELNPDNNNAARVLREQEGEAPGTPKLPRSH